MTIKNEMVRPMTGVNKCLVLALVENVPERHFNLETILSRLQLDKSKYAHALATDFKCLNVQLGLSVRNLKKLVKKHLHR